MGKRARGNGGVYQVPGSRFWQISYQLNKKTERESSGCLTKTAAAEKLKERLLAIGNGNFLGPRIQKISVDELYADLVQDYRIKGQTVEWAERVWNIHLKASFDGVRAANVGTRQIASYVEKRKGESAEESTINRELALLRRAFSLGFDAEPQKVGRVPKFNRFIVSEKGRERRGFVEEHQYQKLKEAARGKLWLEALLAVAYAYGWRKDELLSMRCHQLDLLNNTICLYSGETKNDEGRIVELTEDCRRLLTDLRRGKQPDDFLFTRGKEPVRDFRGAWDVLTKAAGVPGLILHDFRRSAVRNMVRRGVPERVAMMISGHKTRAIFDRYNIIDPSDLRDAVRKIEEGAKAVIHSSFIVAPDQGNPEVAPTSVKPS
jgi:integrase